MSTAPLHGIFGTPKTSGYRQADDAHQIGAHGEQRTASMINQLSKDAAIFHGMQLPIKLRTDIDHLIVRDGAILAIDSKFWQAGTYRSFGGKLYRGFQVIDVPDAMIKAVEILQKLTKGHQLEVSTMVIVHSKRGGAKIASSATKLNPPIFNPPTAQQHIDRWLAAHPGLPSPRLVSRLLNLQSSGRKA